MGDVYDFPTGLRRPIDLLSQRPLDRDNGDLARLLRLCLLAPGIGRELSKRPEDAA